MKNEKLNSKQVNAIVKNIIVLLSQIAPDAMSEIMSEKSCQDHQSITTKEKTFADYLAEVEAQIEIESFAEDFEQVKEIAMIIAEILWLPKDTQVRISGNDCDAEKVAEVFDNIRYEHVAEVIRRYREAKYEIKHTKTYLRTALYNSVFELNARIDNEVRKDMYGGL